MDLHAKQVAWLMSYITCIDALRLDRAGQVRAEQMRGGR